MQQVLDELWSQELVYQKSGKMDKIPGRPAYPRPAGLAPQHTMPQNFARVIMSTNPSQSNLVPSKIHKQRPKGLSNGRLGPLLVSKCSFKTQTALSKNVHPLISKPVKQRAEMCQLQAGRPSGGQPAPPCSGSCSTSRGSYINRPSCLQHTRSPHTDLGAL